MSVEIATHLLAQVFQEPLQLLIPKAPHGLKRIEAVLEKGFRFVDISDAAQDCLIENRFADWSFVVLAKTTQDFSPIYI